MSTDDEFLKKRQAELRAKESTLSKEEKVELSLNVVNQLLDTQERNIRVMTALNDEIKALRKQGGQQSLD